MSFPVSQCAIEGFRVLRRNPGALAVWFLSYFVFFAAVFGLCFAVLAPDFAELIRVNRDSEATSQWFIRHMPLLLGLGVLLVPISIVWGAVQTCAIYRAVLRPNERSVGYLRLGGDEFRMIALLFMIFVLSTLFMVAVVGAFIGLGFAMGQHGRTVLTLVLLGLLVFCGWIFVLVRLSLCIPQTFSERRIDLFGSWTLTRNQFWPLVGMYLLTWLITVGIQIGVGIISLPFRLMMGFGLQKTFEMTPTVITGGVGYLLISTIGGLVVTVLYASARAAAYRSLTGDRENTADAFN